MNRTLPKYVNGYLDRHGKPRHYMRLRGRKKMPLPGLPWSREFMEAYDAALNQSAPVMVIGASRSPPGTVAEAVARYLGSATFTNNFKPATQAMRRAVLNRFRNEHGDKRIGKLEPQYVMRLVLRLRPYAQRNMLKTLRGLMAFAVTEGLIEADPTVGVKLGKVKDTGGFATWSPEHVEQYRARHPLGTRPRLAMELGLGTMQRRGDAVRFGRQHIRDGILSLKQNKTGAEVDIPVLDELREAIDAMSDANLTFLVTEFGKPFTGLDSATGFATNAMPQAYRRLYPSMACAKQVQRALPKRGATIMKSCRGADGPACGKCSDTPVE